jgi:hypothetical protein
MFSPKTLPRFHPSSLKGFFAAHLSAFERLTFLSGLSVSSKKPLSVRAFDLAFAVAFKSAGTYVIPVLSLMGETK